MILYNWKKIKRESKGKVGDIVTILYILTYRKEPPINRKDRRFKFWTKSFHGDSYLFKETDIQILRLHSMQVSLHCAIILTIEVKKIPHWTSCTILVRKI